MSVARCPYADLLYNGNGPVWVKPSVLKADRLCMAMSLQECDQLSTR